MGSHEPASHSMEADVVIVGSGGAGLCAALTAREGCAKVSVFEKQPNPGGSSNFAEGMFGVETDIQRRNYIGITRNIAFKMMMEYNHWRGNPRLVRSFVDESAATIDWLQKQGVEFEGPMAIWPDGLRTWHLLKGPPKARGSVMIKTLVNRLKEKGVDLNFAMPITSITMEGNRVIGVMAEKDGKRVEVNSRAVIIATGGYANNKEWITKYTGFDLDVNVFSIGNVNKTGDGIRMAWEVGGIEDGMGILQLARMGRGLKGMGSIEAARLQPNLFVDCRGTRYCDESIEMNFTYGGNAIARLGGKSSYSIFDEAIKRDMVERGILIGVGMAIPPGTRLVKLDEELNLALQKGNPNVFVADSVKELAEKMKINPDSLRTSIDEYNEYCVKGDDGLFAKDPKFLRPLTEPKFYGVKAVTGFISTLGGIKINHRMEVVDKEDRAIPGLYAAGNDAGGMYGDSYDVHAAGETLGFAVNSGRIAARNALKYIRNE